MEAEKKESKPPSLVESGNSGNSVLGESNEDFVPIEEEIPIINFQRLIKGKRIGSGGYGIVFEGKYQEKKNGKVIDVAIKRLGKIQGTAKYDRFFREVQSHTSLDHQNVVKCYGASVDKNDIYYVVTERIGQGKNPNLRNLIKNPTVDLDIKKKVRLALDIALGMQHYSKSGIVHRDMRPINVLIWEQSRDLLRACICDFGFAHVIEEGVDSDEKEKTRLNVGYERFKAPELRKGGKDIPRFHSDVFSFGMTIWCIFTRRFPEDLGPLEPFIPKEFDDEFSKEALMLCERCVATIPRDRCSIDECVETLERMLKVIGLGVENKLRMAEREVKRLEEKIKSAEEKVKAPWAEALEEIQRLRESKKNLQAEILAGEKKFNEERRRRKDVEKEVNRLRLVVEMGPPSIETLVFERSLMGRSFDSFEIVKELGRGANSIVCKALFKKEPLALKIFFNFKDPNVDNSSYRIRRRLIEGEFLHRLPLDRNLLRIHYCFVGNYDQSVLEKVGADFSYEHFHEKTAFFVTPLCDGTLDDIAKAKTGRPLFEKNKFLLFLWDVVNGLDVLKQKNFIHCDIKEDNIFYKGDTFIVADFDKCYDFSGEREPEKFQLRYNHNYGVWGGAAAYMPEEIAKKHDNGDIITYDKYDVYSLGRVCWNLWSKNKDECREGARLSEEDCDVPQFRELIESMLKVYEERISIEDLKKTVEGMLKAVGVNVEK